MIMAREIAELKKLLRTRLSEAGIENAAFESEQILLAAGIPKSSVLWEPRECVSDEQAKSVADILERRLEGYPLQYLVGEWSFYACGFKVGEGVLIPRQDTETLAELADVFLKKRAPSERRVLDLCAGSGCIGIVLARFCKAEVTSVERSEAAFSYLVENAALNGVTDRVTAVCADIFTEIPEVCGEYDAIVSNPPYLTKADMNKLQREVSYEPREALYGGEDGLDLYRRIPKFYLDKLKKGGLFAVEIGMGQDADVAEIFREHGLLPKFKEDLCGVKRVVYCIK